jgi:hypothetical protein
MKRFLSILIVLLGIQPDIVKADGIFKIKSDLKNYLLPYKVAVHTDIHNHLTVRKIKQFFKNTEFNTIDIQYRFSITVNSCVSSSYRTKAEDRCDKSEVFQMSSSRLLDNYIIDVTSNKMMSG